MTATATEYTPYWYCPQCKAEPEEGTIWVSGLRDTEYHTVCKTPLQLLGRPTKQQESFVQSFIAASVTVIVFILASFLFLTFSKPTANPQAPIAVRTEVK